ncbi:transcriptional regulator with XRE-family HTH domain [Rhizobium aethiopicum]|uniref:helix-turn-helix domain-containing protein n=1 Tax=Rhizobium aethiopicum TaxID=1138170 RepID=UPI001621E4FD|nr:helix-turn-helix transcriptional regulator [Rhizobium aethiopicum]MBB4581560.1 transcriptional regulator with XRE-family HTH domain [Rhizobium aethiopicum]
MVELKILPQDNGIQEMTGGGDDQPREKNIYSRSVSARIKTNIKQEWERQKHLHGKTQEGLAEYLGISQGAVSKLLNDQSGHPWSVDKIELFAGFCEVPLAELIGDQDLIGHFNGWNGDTVPPNTRRIQEAKIALERFIEEQGASLDDAKLHRLAGRLAVRMEGTDRSPKSYNREILKLLISEA